MKAFSSLLISTLIATWVVAIAILSVQNVYVTNPQGGPQLVTLRFLFLRSVEMPFGVVLAFAAGVGIVGTALTLPLLGLSGSSEGFDEEEEF